MKVVVCAGHGLNKFGQIDVGAVNKDYELTERSCCVRIVEFIRRMFPHVVNVDLKAMVIPYSLEKKVLQVNAINPDLAIDVHLNAFDNPTTRGTEVLYYPGSVKGLRAAEVFQRYLVDAMRSPPSWDRKAKARGDLYFLKRTICPAILTEAEFISCPDVAQELSEGLMLHTIAWAHSKAIYELATLWGGTWSAA